MRQLALVDEWKTWTVCKRMLSFSDRIIDTVSSSLSITAKIDALDNELKVYKDKIKKAKSPAAKKTLQKRALEVLKRKRMYEQQRDAVAGQQFNIDQTSFQLESAKASISTVAAMKAANTELKRTLRKDLQIDDVEDLADDMAELMEDFNEINEALGRNFATPEDLDEADLDAELELLGDELEEEMDELEATPSYLQTSKLPAHPTYTPGLPSAPIDEVGLSVPQTS
jgi:charged multivesicular body protein 5